MKKFFLSIAAGSIAFLGVQAKAHDGYDEDHISRVDRYRGADVIHYDHHHYYRDEYGNETVVHHDHHYVVPHDDYRGDRDCDHHSHRSSFPFSFFFGR